MLSDQIHHIHLNILVQQDARFQVRRWNGSRNGGQHCFHVNVTRGESVSVTADSVDRDSIEIAVDVREITSKQSVGHGELVSQSLASISATFTGRAVFPQAHRLRIEQ